jgi:Na+/H+ antiporter NhaA
LGGSPKGVLWPHLLGLAWFAGIGFTMSLFTGQLAFEDQVLVEQAKLDILISSSIFGFAWPHMGRPRKAGLKGIMAPCYDVTESQLI